MVRCRSSSSRRVLTGILALAVVGLITIPAAFHPAGASPDVRVIVQALPGAVGEAEAHARAVGGTLGRRLDIIHGFVATIHSLTRWR
jgi:hypothetical protein